MVDGAGGAPTGAAFHRLVEHALSLQQVVGVARVRGSHQCDHGSLERYRYVARSRVVADQQRRGVHQRLQILEVPLRIGQGDASLLRVRGDLAGDPDFRVIGCDHQHGYQVEASL